VKIINIKIKLVFLLITCVLLSSNYVQAKTKLKYLKLHVGEVKVLPINKVDRVAIGLPDVVNYQILDNGQLLLIAKSPGETNLHIWEHKNRELKFVVKVTKDDMSHELKIAKTLSSDVDGLRVRQLNGNIIFEGNVSVTHKEKLAAIMSAVPNSVALYEYNDFDVEKMVRMDVRIVELNKKAASQIGIRWQQSMSGPIMGLTKGVRSNDYFRVFQNDSDGINEGIVNATPNDSHFYGYLGITSTISSSIDLMAEAGDARILATPKLLTKSGDEASFLSGGEFPVLVINSLGQSEILFREYGIKVDIKPTVNDENNINTFIHAELSSIDSSVTVSGVPGLLSRKVDTTINVKNNDTIVISGLASMLESEQTTKVPFLGDIPVLGALFRSKQKVRQQTEVVIFVTPRLVEPKDSDNQKLLNYGIELRDHFADDRVNQALME